MSDTKKQLRTEKKKRLVLNINCILFVQIGSGFDFKSFQVFVLRTEE